MNTLMDEQTTTVILESLDFEVTCDVVGSTGHCQEAADYQMECIGCGGMCGPLCVSHAIYARTSERPLTHRSCGLEGPLRDIVTVVPL